MNEKIIPVTRVLEDSFVYSCTFEQRFSDEQFVPYHVLAFQFSGETTYSNDLQNGRLVLKKESNHTVSKKSTGKIIKNSRHR